MKYLKLLSQLLRVKQWLKNVLVVLPALIEPSALGLSHIYPLLITFLLFCSSASLIYVINDWVDKDSDSKHETKKLRPFASGDLGVRSAVVSIFVLTTSSVFLGALAFQVSETLAFIVAVYIVQSISYSIFLKNVTLIEMMIVSTGYSYRVLAGGFAIALVPSIWMIATIFLASLFMISQKRLADINLLKDGSSQRRSFRLYNESFLSAVTVIAASSAIVSYLMFTLSDYAQTKFANDLLPASAIFVVYATLRYIQRASFDNSGQDPLSLIVSDKHILLCICAAVIFLSLTNIP